MMEHVFNLLISPAYADTPEVPAPQNGSMSLVLMFLIFFVFMYFTVWRPQSKRAKEQQNLLQALAVGDEVMTSGGILGKITKVSDQHVSVSLSDTVTIAMQKSSIVSILPKGTLKSIV